MKNFLVLAVVAAASTGALATGQKPAGSNAGQQQQQQQQTTTTSVAEASNAGNQQTIAAGAIVVNAQIGPSEQARDTTTRTITDAVVEQRGDTTQRIVYSGTQTVRNVPSVSGPPLVSSNDTCMGSSSGSFNIAGVGLGAGTTWTDQNCKMLKNSRELWNMGMKGAALALMCTDAMNREALELTGFECPQTTREREAAAKKPVVAAVEQPQYTDPIVRRRLGLPPL